MMSDVCWITFRLPTSFMKKFLFCLSVRKMSTVPIAVVLGATGTGKSKLAIALARMFNGEVINADSMQVYRGLDIVTNKIPESEQLGCPHHLLGIVDPLKRFTVIDFRNRCLPIIDSLRSQGKMPVLVGGTHYYMESVLWNVLVEESGTDSTELLLRREEEMGRKDILASDAERVAGNDIAGYSREALLHPEINFVDVPNSELHELLKKVDPDAADGFHPNDRRKIMRSLQVFAQHNKRHSNFLESQRKVQGGSSLGGPLRYENVVLFWLQCDATVLDERLDSRVDQMVAAGLVEELTHFQRESAGRNLPYTQGIFQSIGFKELHDFLVLPDEERTSESALKALEVGVIEIKQRTRQYARRQLQWIKNRFLNRADRQLPPMFGLDASDPAKWETVEAVAASVVQSIIDGRPSPVQALQQSPREVDKKITNHCAPCDRVFISASQWKTHLGSIAHKRGVQRKRKKETALIVPEIKSSSLLVTTSEEFPLPII